MEINETLVFHYTEVNMPLYPLLLQLTRITPIRTTRHLGVGSVQR